MHINVEKGNLFGGLNLANLLLGCAIHFVMHLAVLNKLIVGNHGLEFVHGYKIVVNAINFTSSWWACRVGHTEAELFWELARQKVDKCAFAGTRGTNDHSRFELDPVNAGLFICETIFGFHVELDKLCCLANSCHIRGSCLY